MGTSVAVPGEAPVAPEKYGVGDLPPSIQQALQLRKMQNVVAAELAKLSWGKNLEGTTLRAIAEYGRKFRIDPTTELDVLGGRLYPNARYYLRRLAEKVTEGEIQYAVADHIHVDPRLIEMARQAPPEGASAGEAALYAGFREQAIRELGRRQAARVEYNVPDAATAAVVFRVKHRKLDREVVGVKWCGGGTRKNDPVGDQFPVETAESRAARRAMRQLVSHMPTYAEEYAAMEAEGVKIEAKIAEDAARFIPPRGGTSQLAHSDLDDPLGIHAERRAIATGMGGGDDETGLDPADAAE